MVQLVSVIKHMNIKDVCDIFFVSIIIYQLLSFIKGTRAVQMLVGVIGFVGLYWLSQKYSLFALNWILDQFFEYFFIIFVILFQEQLRSVLMSLGKARVLKRNSNTSVSQNIEEVVEACSVLSKEKTGALIVFERRNGLANYMATGTTLESEIHSDVLYSFFQTKSPLHDGALIIAENKIKAAGCFLPLSKNVEIDRHLGTRHRAALGVSEATDAVVVIVSEETGEIKVCFNGIFYQMKSSKALRRQLKGILTASDRLKMMSLSSNVDGV